MINNDMLPGENKDIVFIVIKGNKYPCRSRIDKDSTYLIIGHKWSRNKNGYIYCTKHGELFHRVVVGAKTCDIVDHINHDTTDNRKVNLRKVSHRENMRNRKTNRDSMVPVKGVYIHQNKWRSQISINGKTINLGTYDELYDAALSRIRKEYELFGVHSFNYRPVLKTIPLVYKRFWLPEIYGKNNISFIDTNFHKAFFKNCKETEVGMINKLKRYAIYGDGKQTT